MGATSVRALTLRFAMGRKLLHSFPVTGWLHASHLLVYLHSGMCRYKNHVCPKFVSLALGKQSALPSCIAFLVQCFGYLGQ